MNRVPAWRIVAALLVIAVLVAITVVLAPIYYRNLLLQRAVVEITHDVHNPAKPDEVLRSILLKRAGELELPVKADNVHIQRFQGALRVDIGYFVRVAFPGYTVDLHFHPGASSR